MTQGIGRDAVMLLPLVLQLVGLSFSVTVDSYLNKEQKRVFGLIITLVAVLIAQSYADFWLDRHGIYPLLRTIASINGYIVRPMILLYYTYVVEPRGKHKIAWILIACNTVIHLTSLFSGICFRFDENANFLRGPLGYTCHIISGIMLLNLVVLTYRQFDSAKHGEAWIPVMNALVVITAVILDSEPNYHQYPPLSYLTMAVVSTSLFYYIWLHLQFVRNHEQDLMAQQRIRIMISQIQPHFLYNTLSTIQALCRTDPEKAALITERFGTYLRQNIDTLEQPDLIPVRKELEHTRIYTEIEETRFPDIRVEYFIEDDAFRLPALSIQPLVENAIRHGARYREKGAFVRISTECMPDCHLITVQDNGRGFQADELPGGEESHIGIRNVRERLETMCGGDLKIQSTPGEGTLVTIRIPARGVEP